MIEEIILDAFRHLLSSKDCSRYFASSISGLGLPGVEIPIMRPSMDRRTNLMYRFGNMSVKPTVQKPSVIDRVVLNNIWEDFSQPNGKRYAVTKYPELEKRDKEMIHDKPLIGFSKPIWFGPEDSI